MCKSDLYTQKDRVKILMLNNPAKRILQRGLDGKDGVREHTRGDLFFFS